MIKKLLRIFFLLVISIESHAYNLTPYIPNDNPQGIGIIVCPGGSYFWLDKQTEGRDVAKWLNENGIAAFVLEYAHGGWGAFAFHIRFGNRSFPSGFNDLYKALSYIRENAKKFKVNPDKIGCMGFSAGGHLVMHAAEQLAGTNDAPFFVAPMYPVVSMTHSCTHRRSRRGLLGEFQTKGMRDSLSLEHHVPLNCPPVFLMNCNDDPIVHYHNAELLDSALTSKGVPHHYERYRTGGHGFGATKEKTTEEAILWKSAFLKWLNKLVRR